MSELNTPVKLDEGQRRLISFLSEDPAEIWGEVISKDKRVFIDLCKTFEEIVFAKGFQSYIARKLAWYLHRFHYKKKGHYIKESDWLAKQSDGILSRSQMAFIQRSYTWAHFGCSTICIWDSQAGENVCMRSLDWEGAEAIGKATRVFEFQDVNSKILFKTAGVVGMVGVLTGVKTGFSVVINYAPWGDSSADGHADPTLKLRLLLENNQINSYEEAKGAISSWEVGAPVFITLCGILKDQACVIEIGHDETKYIRESRNGILVQTNHFDSDSIFKDENVEMKDVPVDKDGNEIDNWYDGKLLPSSEFRRRQLEEALIRSYDSSNELNQFLEDQYKNKPIWNYETAQWVRMRPRSGDIEVWARP